MFCLALDQLAEELDIECDVFSIDDSLADYEAAGSPWKHLKLIPCDSQLGMLHRVVRHAAGTRPDLIIAGIQGMAPVGLLSSPFLRVGYGYFAHGCEIWTKPKWSRRTAARRATRVFPVSKDTARILHQTSGLPAERMRVLNNTLEPSFELSEHEVKTPDVDQGFDILSVARLWKSEGRKGIDTTISAFARLAPRFPNVRYRIVGHGDDKPRLIELAASLGVADQVLFEENLTDDELMQRYRDCGIFALPSGQEGFGIVFLEAMQYSTPCIGGNIGGTPEVVEDGKTGILVPFGDTDAMEAALLRLLPDSDLRRTMGAAGLQRLRDHFLFPGYRNRVREYLTEWLALP